MATFFRLMAEHGSAQAALTALPEIARAAGVDRYDPCPEAVALAEMRAGRKAGAHLVCFGDPDYPTALSDIPDPPPVLWLTGDPALAKRPAVALVGARNASSLGLRMARSLAGALGEAGFAVVSGLARGIDAAAHDAALAHGTLAVLGGGVDVAYPRENTALFDQIGDRGLRLSECAMGHQPQARDFPRRNRLISGLARGLVVVEAAPKSGSLITARTALDQGREVMAVPGHPFDGRAAGCNMLLRDGATLVRGVEDVIEAIGAARDAAPAPGLPCAYTPRTRAAAGTAAGTAAAGKAATRPSPGPDDTVTPADILGLLAAAPVSEDALLRDLGCSTSAGIAALVELELDGLILRHPGGLVSAAVPAPARA